MSGYKKVTSWLVAVKYEMNTIGN